MSERMTDAEFEEKACALVGVDIPWSALFGFMEDEARRARRMEAEQAEELKRKDKLIRELAETMNSAADELDLAAQHKANPGSTNGTLVQVAATLRKAGRM